MDVEATHPSSAAAPRKRRRMVEDENEEEGKGGSGDDTTPLRGASRSRREEESKGESDGHVVAAASASLGDIVPEIKSTFISAKLSDLRAYNASAHIPSEPDGKYLCADHAFTITFHSPSAIKSLFKMTDRVLRSNGSTSDHLIACNVVMYMGQPYLAIDVMDPLANTLNSHRARIDVRLHPDFAGSNGRFPVMNMICNTCVEKFETVREQQIAQWIMMRTGENDKIMMATFYEGECGLLQMDSINLFAPSADAGAPTSMRDVVHNFTVSMRSGALSTCCKRCTSKDKTITFSIFTDRDCMVHELKPSEKIKLTFEAKTSNERGELYRYIRVIDIHAERDEESGEFVQHEEDATDETHHQIQARVERSEGLRLSQTFPASYIKAFLKEIDQNRNVFMRFGSFTDDEGIQTRAVMTLVYKHGPNVISQLIVSPIEEVDA